jgi:hypothetical protein
MKWSNLPPDFAKPAKSPPQAVFGRWVCYSNNGFATVTKVLSFSFLFIPSESLRNHKMENPILFDST